MADYSDKYYDASFWQKIGKVAAKLGREGMEKALLLYYVMLDSDTPAAAKAIVVAALGYFIFPIDAIPDVLLGVGYTDDIGVMVGALTAVASNVKDAHRKQAAEKAEEWFG